MSFPHFTVIFVCGTINTTLALLNFINVKKVIKNKLHLIRFLEKMKKR
jgi:energy-converting hydrogenase Eha subunit E